MEIFIDYFFKGWIKHNILQYKGIFYVAFAIIIVIFIMCAMAEAKKSYLKTLLIIIVVALLPMACNASLFIATKSGIIIQMTAGMAILFPTILCFTNNIRKVKKETYKPIIVFMAISVIILYGNVYMVAIDQETMYEGKSSTITLVHEAITELREKHLLSTDKSYLFIGTPSNNPLFKTTPFWDMSNAYAKYGQFWASTDCFRMSYVGLFRDMGINLQYVSDDIAIQLNKKEDVQNMPVFPIEGSIQEIDGYVVVKISN